MKAVTKEELVQIAHTYYPVQSADGTKDATAALLGAQRTPEYSRWEAAWERAVHWKKCDILIQAIQAAFPGHRAGRFMQPRRVACLYCILVLETPGSDGGRNLTRIVGALSVLAPLYLVYVTTEILGVDRCSARPGISFTPQDREKPYARTMARLIEHHLGYRPFPLEWADVPVPDLQVDFLHSEQPTLLTALFANHLEDLP